MRSRPLLRTALFLERRAIGRAFAAGILVSLSTVGLAGTSAWLIVRAAQEPAVLSLTVPMGLVQLFALAKAAGRYVERTQTHRAALSVMGRVRASTAYILRTLVPAGLGPRSSSVVETVLGDVERVQDVLTAVAGPLSTSAVAGAASIVVSGVMVPWSGFVLLAGVLIVGVILPLLAASMGNSSEVALEKVRHGLNAIFDNAAQAGSEVLLLGGTPTMMETLRTLEEQQDRSNRRRTFVMGAVSALNTVVAGVCVLGAVLVTTNAYREGHVAQALLAVPALLSVSALELLSGIAPLVVSFRRDQGALARLQAIGDILPPVVEPAFTLTPPPSRVLRAKQLQHTLGTETVIADVSIEFRPGDVVVLEGPSGAGKTTLARIFAKFVDHQDGEMALGTLSYRSLSSSCVRDSVGYVDDDPHIFLTTLAGNLRIANPHASDEELTTALEAAGLGPLLSMLPEGLSNMIGGATQGLSGGEQRRLGVARQLLCMKNIVILDEPTEGLDEPTANALMASLIEYCRDRVLIVISHHESDRSFATRALRLEGGLLSELEVPAGSSREDQLV